MGLETATILWIAASASAAGAGVAAYSAYQQGQAAKRLNDYNANLSQQNSEIAQRDAAVQANAVRLQNRRIQARQRAAFAANGVVGETGSPLLEEANQAAYLEMGALETERQGNIRAGQYAQQSVLDRMRGKAAGAAGNLNAAATILQGAGKAAGAYYGLGG